MYLHASPHETPVTNIPVAEAKSWLTNEIFWMGVWSSVVAGVVVYYMIERKTRRG